MANYSAYNSFKHTDIYWVFMFHHQLQSLLTVISKLTEKSESELILSKVITNDLVIKNPGELITQLLDTLNDFFELYNNSILSLSDSERIENQSDLLHVLINDLCRKNKIHHSNLTLNTRSFDDTENLGIHVMQNAPPWEKNTHYSLRIPGMITNEEARYYSWLSKFYSAKGRIVELGPWLGASTIAIHEGLKNNPHFANEKLYVFDDFIWRKSWMDPYIEPKNQLPNHACFRHLFDRLTNRIANDLVVQQSRFALYDGNDNVPPMKWDKGDIEMIFVDCGRTIEANESWYSCLLHHFIPGTTLIVMQDWRLHRELPRKWFNQTELFTESKGSKLQMIHEVQDGGIATFLFT